MEYCVTGCEGCPFADSAWGEYQKWCNHPFRPLRIGYYENGVWYPYDLTYEQKNEIIKRWKKEGDVPYIEMNDFTYWVESLPIEDDKVSYKPIMPEWCPLKVEPITISLKKED